MRGMAFAVNLKKKRIQAGMTQKELADITGIGQSHLCNYERCKIAPTQANIKRLTKALGCEEMDIIIDKESADARFVAEYLGISKEATLKLRNLGQDEKRFFDGVIRGYLTA